MSQQRRDLNSEGAKTRSKHRARCSRLYFAPSLLRYSSILSVLLGLILLSRAASALADAPALTFNKDIAPLVFRHCSSCHRPGQSGPFPLLTYGDVKKRARQIVEVTARRYMPPWLPEPGYGEFDG